jgi:hypothetical protein
MARNLSRNTELYVSTLAPADIAGSAVGTPTVANTNNTWKVNVLDGYSFSQDTSTQEVGVSEAASECTGVAGLARATLTFNTALNPVDVSFGVYVRPTNVGGAMPTCTELPLWAAALGNDTAYAASPAAASAGATYAQAIGATDSLTFTTEQSDQNELLLLYLYFVLDSTTYVVGEFTVGTIEADFSIDGIAMLNISGSGTTIQENPSNVHAQFGTTTPALTAGTNYVDVPTTTSSSFLRNKLGTLELVDNQGVAGTGDDTVASSSVSGQVISGFTGLTVDEYIGGRAYSAAAGAWASIVDNDATTVTVADYEDISDANWDSTDVDLYLPSSHAAVSYCIPITGGSLTLENNMSYLTPEELAIVNQPLAGFTGSRSISGSVTAYLNTGAMGSGGLLQDLLEKTTEVNNDFALTFHMGNDTGSVPRVDFTIPHAQVSIPTTNVEDIISTEITFNAKSWSATTDAQSFEGANEMTVAYVLDQP